MNLRPRRKDEFDLNVISFIDVLLVLLIFFVVTTTFKQSFNIALVLPEATSDKRQPETRIDLTIDGDGNFYVDRSQLVNNQSETLKQVLLKVTGGKTNVPLIISADSKTPHQAVITAMDAARQVGFAHFGLATKQTEGSHAR
ncbi:MAG: biopolymer transporter ExbD [Pseudomonadota bacterium]